MNNTKEYLFPLEKGSKKHKCPQCHRKTLVRHIDGETGEYMPDNFGRCDREEKCGYWKNPNQNPYFKAFMEKRGFFEQLLSKTPSRKEVQKSELRLMTSSKPVEKTMKHTGKPIFIPNEILSKTLGNYKENTFIRNLLSNVPYPLEDVYLKSVISLYYLGTLSKGSYKGAVTFPFIDQFGQVRTIQVKQFDEHNHTTKTNFLHSILHQAYQKRKAPALNWLNEYISQDKKVTCLFGEHLLQKYPDNPIALVEAPKTAIYGTLYFGIPETPKAFLWLAVYSLSTLTLDKCRALKGRNVVLFPDVSESGRAYELWSAKAKQFNKAMPNTRFIVSSFLEAHANIADREKGLDLADYLIEKDWRVFRSKAEESIKEDVEVFAPKKALDNFLKDIEDGNAIADRLLTSFDIIDISEYSEEPEVPTPEPDAFDLESLEAFFNRIDLPDHSVKLSEGETIENCDKLINMHLATLRNGNKKSVLLPYYERLQRFREILEGKQKKYRAGPFIL